MAAIKLPAWPQGVAGNVWANKLADASVYAVESNLFNYDTGTAVALFSIPEDSIILGIGIEMVTAMDGGGAQYVQVADTGAVLATFGDNVVSNVQFSWQPVLKRYTKAAGVPGNAPRTIQLNVNDGAAAAGTFRVWLQLKPNRGAKNALKAQSVT